MNLDNIIYDFIYNNCVRLGSSFGYGFLEGLCMYILCIGGPVIAILEKRRKKWLQKVLL